MKTEISNPFTSYTMREDVSNFFDNKYFWKLQSNKSINAFSPKFVVDLNRVLNIDGFLLLQSLLPLASFKYVLLFRRELSRQTRVKNGYKETESRKHHRL